MANRFGPIALLIAFGLVASAAIPVRAQAEPEKVRCKASTRYQAGSFHRFTLGGGYRDLWEAEIELEVLDLQNTAGGLTPSGRFGGLQSAVLGFKGADGRAYSFRGTDKDPSAILGVEFQQTMLRNLVQDQMAAQHPGGPLAAGVLTNAAGVLTITERMMVMPDDPALGEYREEFAGMVGSFFVYPLAASDDHEGFHGATKILSHKKLYAALKAGWDIQVDAEAFARARLMDMLLGDFDRHRKQWRWAKLPGNEKWQPIPEDRDQAFVRYDGIGQQLGSIYVPILQNYDEDYPSIEGLTSHGWEQDRWLLAELEWAAWERIAKDIQARLTHSVIEEALAALPPEYAALDGERFRRDVRGRRDGLLDAARTFYEQLAEYTDIHATEDTERVEVEWTVSDELRIEIWRSADEPGSEPVYSRRFDPRDTDEVRIYLRGGADVVKTSGDPGGIHVRLISGGGEKLIDDRLAGGVLLYDELDSTRVWEGSGTHVDTDVYVPPPSDAGFVDVEDVPPRDWGYHVMPYPKLALENEVGFILGAAVSITEFGFRRDPWARKHVLSAAMATTVVQPEVEYMGRFRLINSKHQFTLQARYSGVDLVRFFGFGNETQNTQGKPFYRVRNQRTTLTPGFSWLLYDDQIEISTRLWAGFSRTWDSDGRLLGQERPYGSGQFGHTGARLRFTLDTRGSEWAGDSTMLPIGGNPAAGYPTSGFRVDVQGNISPPIWDVEDVYGTVAGSVAWYWGIPGGRFAGSVRVGGKHNLGPTPFFDAAHIGGGRFLSKGSSMRGFRPQRFLGESAVYGNLDLRLFIVNFTLFVPIDFGIHAFVDAGRVFVDGENSSAWHPNGGGGIWFAPLSRLNTIAFSVAASDEDVMFYVGPGFHY